MSNNESYRLFTDENLTITEVIIDFDKKIMKVSPEQNTLPRFVQEYLRYVAVNYVRIKRMLGVSGAVPSLFKLSANEQAVLMDHFMTELYEHEEKDHLKALYVLAMHVTDDQASSNYRYKAALHRLNKDHSYVEYLLQKDEAYQEFINPTEPEVIEDEDESLQEDIDIDNVITIGGDQSHADKKLMSLLDEEDEVEETLPYDAEANTVIFQTTGKTIDIPDTDEPISRDIEKI